jgi:hypothetical protein
MGPSSKDRSAVAVSWYIRLMLGYSTAIYAASQYYTTLLMLHLVYPSITRYNILNANDLDHSLGILGSNVLGLGARKVNILLCKVHLSGEGGVGLPLAGGTGCGLLQHLVDLFER